MLETPFSPALRLQIVESTPKPPTDHVVASSVSDLTTARDRAFAKLGSLSISDPDYWDTLNSLTELDNLLGLS